MNQPLKEQQQQLMAYLLGQDEKITAQVVDQGEVDAVTRLAIYRNAYRIRLQETIDTDHPVLGTYLGDDLFEQMVAGYIDNYPSKYNSLRQFADRLPEFLLATEPFSQWPWIAELARFERMLLVAFDAADSERARSETLQEIAPDLWPELQVVFHPSVQLFETTWNAVDMWQALKAEGTPPEPVQEAATWALWRNAELLTEFRSLDAAEVCLLQGCLRGENLAVVCESLCEFLDPEDISPVLVNTLLQWLQDGLVRYFRFEQQNFG